MCHACAHRTTTGRYPRHSSHQRCPPPQHALPPLHAQACCSKRLYPRGHLLAAVCGRWACGTVRKIFYETLAFTRPCSAIPVCWHESGGPVIGKNQSLAHPPPRWPPTATAGEPRHMQVVKPCVGQVKLGSYVDHSTSPTAAHAAKAKAACTTLLPCLLPKCQLREFKTAFGCKINCCVSIILALLCVVKTRHAEVPPRCTGAAPALHQRATTLDALLVAALWICTNNHNTKNHFTG